MSLNLSENFSSNRSSEQRLSDEQYEVLSCQGQVETFDQAIQTQFQQDSYSIDQMFSVTQPECIQTATQTTGSWHEEIDIQLEKLGEANKKMAMRNIELQSQLKEAKEKVKKYSKISFIQLSKQNQISSLKEVLESYKNEQKLILNFLDKNLGFNISSSNKSLKVIIENILVELTQHLHAISRELTLMKIMSSGETSEKVEAQKKVYNHWSEMRKISEIKENIIKLHQRAQGRKQ